MRLRLRLQLRLRVPAKGSGCFVAWVEPRRQTTLRSESWACACAPSRGVQQRLCTANDGVLFSLCSPLPALPCTTPVPAVIDKAVSKGVLHLNTAARRKARLAAARRNVLVAAGLYTPAPAQ